MGLRASSSALACPSHELEQLLARGRRLNQARNCAVGSTWSSCSQVGKRSFRADVEPWRRLVNVDEAVVDHHRLPVRMILSHMGWQRVTPWQPSAAASGQLSARGPCRRSPLWSAQNEENSEAYRLRRRLPRGDDSRAPAARCQDRQPSAVRKVSGTEIKIDRRISSSRRRATSWA